MPYPLRPLLVILALSLTATIPAVAQDAGDAVHGKALFLQSCAICHADSSGPGDAAVVKQGPSLVGVFGRKAGTGAKFNYTYALMRSGLTWDAATLDTFLTNPANLVPGTSMPAIVEEKQDRLDLIAYLKTLHGPGPEASLWLMRNLHDTRRATFTGVSDGQFEAVLSLRDRRPMGGFPVVVALGGLDHRLGLLHSSGMPSRVWADFVGF